MLINRMRWHLDADVIVVGYGAAGVAAAITAHDAGAQVIILEKEEANTPINNSFMSGGLFICPNDSNGAIRYMEALYRVEQDLYWTDPDIIRTWVELSMQNKKWIEDMGGAPHLFRRSGQHRLPGMESIDIYRFPGRGPGMMHLLYRQVSQRNIQVMRGMRAAQLLMNSRSEIVGVRGVRETDQKPLNVRARRAVILATGGFEFDEQMKLQYLKVYPAYFDASPSLTGDGVRMALDVGAQLWHMNCFVGRCTMKFPEVVTGIRTNFGGRAWQSPGVTALPEFGGGWQAQHLSQLAAVAGYLLIDRDGKRYTNENLKNHTFIYELTLFDSQRLMYPRVPSYWIFDQKRIDNGPLPPNAGAVGPAKIYKWSADNSEELQRGWIKSGNTVRELAAGLGVDARTLEETINTYNRYSDKGVDEEFGRQPDTLIPLTHPPYYGVAVWPGGMNTQGGPRRNAKTQVLRADGTPVPRLYGAGELGSIFGMLYPGGGGNLSECFALGRIAGQNAAEWSPL